MVASHPELYASADNADFVNKVFFKRPQLHPDAGEEGLKKIKIMKVTTFPS